MEFPELAELAKEIYDLLSKLLQSVNSVKVEVIARTVVSIKLYEELKIWEIDYESRLRK